ncbi:hypothetical protein PVA44_06140 [Entomospira nematocerorum]|uniref:Outer membrane protein beta-barrel domain-containing protein n=1 Tax=Entomospira nematocerorum TaxID=2719987 RepID=A0A968GAN7_9SPIO|nr:hypothetical protein [Entomospira nematocera]NIZ46400.1 hypothetical protein [Entomospira nematocera]WDI33796.1 hypothetical protein PVA44_06140 [Entomospira nematocera]
MNNKLLAQLFFILPLIISPIIALEDIHIGIQAGGELAATFSKYHTAHDSSYREHSFFELFTANDTHRRLISGGFLGGVFTEIGFSPTFSLHIGFNIGFARSLSQKNPILTKQESTLNFKTTVATHQSLQLDLLLNFRPHISGFYSKFGIGGIINTPPTVIAIDENGKKQKQAANMSTIHLGLNIINESGWTIALGYLEEHFLHIGLRVALDVTSLFIQKNSHDPESPPIAYAHMSPFAIGLTLGYSYKFLTY